MWSEKHNGPILYLDLCGNGLRAQASNHLQMQVAAKGHLQKVFQHQQTIMQME